MYLRVACDCVHLPAQSHLPGSSCSAAGRQGRVVALGLSRGHSPSGVTFCLRQLIEIPGLCLPQLHLPAYLPLRELRQGVSPSGGLRSRGRLLDFFPGTGPERHPNV